ncbi:MAG: N-acetylmuramoyl-L-alanine amidase [Alphaproteobacteria bacterium]|nr:N-acetylmuramoyl-L-alanine amidase [Alphaproteobacteria bacterium]
MTGAIDLPSPNHGPRPPGTAVRLLVLHYTGMVSAAAALARLCDPAAAVSAHYLIDAAGTAYRLVPEDRRAWHAGVSSWQGEGDVNAASIGIELDNPGHEWGYRPFPEVQMLALVALATGILARHPIPPAGVVGHSDVAPRRKVDPGELFDWRGLAAAGIGIWPDDLDDPAPEAPPFPAAEGLRRLARFGYALDDAAAAVAAFQRRFRPARIDGALDAETLWRIARLVRGG